MQIVSHWTVRKEAVGRLGEEEVARREAACRLKAWRIADDPSWFPEDKGQKRADIAAMMNTRLCSLAYQVSDANAEKLLRMDHDSAACLVVRLMEKGVII